MFYEDSKSIINIYKYIEISIGLILIGLIMFIMGMVFLLDRGFLAIGNVTFKF